MLIANIDGKTIDVDYNRGIMVLENMAQMLNQHVSIEENGTLTGPLTPYLAKNNIANLWRKQKTIFTKEISFRLYFLTDGQHLSPEVIRHLPKPLRKTNPSPYMFYFSSNDVEIAGASPETLVKLENNKSVLSHLQAQDQG